MVLRQQIHVGVHKVDTRVQHSLMECFLKICLIPAYMTTIIIHSDRRSDESKQEIGTFIDRIC